MSPNSAQQDAQMAKRPGALINVLYNVLFIALPTTLEPEVSQIIADYAPFVIGSACSNAGGR